MFIDFLCPNQLLCQGVQRSGALAALTFGCFKHSKCINGRHVIPIGRHKTAGATDQANVVIKDSVFRGEVVPYMELVAGMLGYNEIADVPNSQVSKCLHKCRKNN